MCGAGMTASGLPCSILSRLFDVQYTLGARQFVPDENKGWEIYVLHPGVGAHGEFDAPV